MEYDPADTGTSQLEEHGGGGRREFGVDQERQGGKQQADPFDSVGSGLAPQEGINHRHLDRLGPDSIHDFRPTTPGNPLIPVGIERSKSQHALGGNCGEEQMSQIGPYLSQMGPKTSKRAPPDWPVPLLLRAQPPFRKGFL